MKPRTLETIVNAATFAVFLCVMGLAYAAVTDPAPAVAMPAQAEYRAELAAAAMCGEEGMTAVWNSDTEVECLKDGD